jgi:hypothetical protein
VELRATSKKLCAYVGKQYPFIAGYKFVPCGETAYGAKLYQYPPNTPVMIGLTSEVCLRQVSIHYIVTSVHKAGVTKFFDDSFIDTARVSIVPEKDSRYIDLAGAVAEAEVNSTTLFVCSSLISIFVHRNATTK